MAAIRPASTTIHTPANTFETGNPHTMGMVLHLYLRSPSISSISFITSRINEIIKAKPAYTKDTFNNLCHTISWGEILKRYSATVNTRITHAVNNEMRILPMSNFFLKVVE